MQQSDIQGNDFSLPRGFVAAAVAGGIKKDGSLDMGLLMSLEPAETSGLFTSSQFTGHCVDICRERLKSRKEFLGVLATSGNSNTATGAQGRQDSERLLAELSHALKPEISLAARDLLISHTGVIGERLPMDKMEQALPELGQALAQKWQQSTAEPDKQQSQKEFAQAIMTTDSHPKGASITIAHPDGHYRLSGVAKGAGMIAPNMATMLCYITTDAALSGQDMTSMLAYSIERSFNSITIDGDMSPDDTVLFMANGASGITISTEQDKKLFAQALEQLTLHLAKELVRDGEGASKLVTITVHEAATYEQAKQAGLTVANSLLVKTAFFGEDANWGRIITALGYSETAFELSKISLYLGPHPLLRRGEAVPFSEKELKGLLAQSEFSVDIYLAQGEQSATVYTSDLSYDYVKINAEYRS
jgi:glutamate N-acetyltransferase/amino-acid N-acetyltransferase